MYKSRFKIVSKFVEKLQKYMILFKDILILEGLYYKDASLMTLYFFVLGITMKGLESIGQF